MITGVSTGIGASCVRYFLDRDYQVFGSVRKKEDAEMLKKELGDQFHPVIFDVIDEKAVQAGAKRVSEILDNAPLHGLVNNAGIATPGPLEHLGVPELEKQLDVNVLGVLRVTQAFLPLLKPVDQKAAGRIINMSSISGIIGVPFNGPYVTSKFALEGFSDCLRRELMLYGIKVIVIQPGPIQSEIWGKVIAQELKYPENSIYHPILKHQEKIIAKTIQNALPTLKVAEAVFKAMEASRPKTRYMVYKGTWKIRIARLLPDRWIDHIVSKNLKKFFKQRK